MRWATVTRIIRYIILVLILVNLPYSCTQDNTKLQFDAECKRRANIIVLNKALWEEYLIEIGKFKKLNPEQYAKSGILLYLPEHNMYKYYQSLLWDSFDNGGRLAHIRPFTIYYTTIIVFKKEHPFVVIDDLNYISWNLPNNTYFRCTKNYPNLYVKIQKQGANNE